MKFLTHNTVKTDFASKYATKAEDCIRTLLQVRLTTYIYLLFPHWDGEFVLLREEVLVSEVAARVLFTVIVSILCLHLVRGH